MFLIDLALSLLLMLGSMIPTVGQYNDASASIDGKAAVAEVMTIRDHVKSAFSTRSNYAGLSTASAIDLEVIDSQRGPGGSTLALQVDSSDNSLFVIDLNGVADSSVCVSLATENTWAWRSIHVGSEDVTGDTLEDIVSACQSNNRVILRAS